jgi:formylglycine-generating enzyme required for sulfatase activity/uncharacterized caspase-like protein
MTSEAIVIGVNDYEYLQPLSYARQDALAVKRFLEEEAKFDRVYYLAEDAPAVNGMSMKPTRNNLRRVMRGTFERPFMGDGDNFWFFFSGHGMRDGERDFLMPIDGDPDDIAESGISTAQVSEWLRGCGADNVVMILDACRSGGRKDGKGIGDETREGCRQTGVISLFSCSPNQFSYELEPYQQGAFTKVLLDGLGVQGGCATVARLDEYLKRRVPEVVRDCLGDRATQVPYSIAEPINKSHLILMPQHSRPEDLAALKMDALRAQVANDVRLAYQCWLRVNIASRGLDMEAIDAIVELKPKLNQPQQPHPESKPEPPVAKGKVETSTRSLLPIAAQPLKPIFVKRKTEIAHLSPIILPSFKFQYATIDDKLAIIKHDGTAHYHRETINGVDIDLIQIPDGSFDMGSNEFDDEKPIHRVTVPEFLMGKYPVTQAQWKAVAQLKQQKRKLKPDPSNSKGADRPVESITWDEAVEFCDRLSAHTNRNYRLPSEAEWEYACRAGTTTPFHFGKTIDASIANYDATKTYGKGRKGTYRKQTTSVGSFPANAWGLFDCHGNVWEWCSDLRHDSYTNAPTDGSPWLKDGNTECKIIRGGSWIYAPVDCRSALRYFTSRADSRCGFRLSSSSFVRVSRSTLE